VASTWTSPQHLGHAVHHVVHRPARSPPGRQSARRRPGRSSPPPRAERRDQRDRSGIVQPQPARPALLRTPGATGMSSRSCSCGGDQNASTITPISLRSLQRQDELSRRVSSRKSIRRFPTRFVLRPAASRDPCRVAESGRLCPRGPTAMIMKRIGSLFDAESFDHEEERPQAWKGRTTGS